MWKKIVLSQQGCAEIPHVHVLRVHSLGSIFCRKEEVDSLSPQIALVSILAMMRLIGMDGIFSKMILILKEVQAIAVLVNQKRQGCSEVAHRFLEFKQPKRHWFDHPCAVKCHAPSPLLQAARL